MNSAKYVAANFMDGENQVGEFIVTTVGKKLLLKTIMT